MFAAVAGPPVTSHPSLISPKALMSVHIPASAIGTSYEDDDDHSDGSGQSEEDNKELESFDDWLEAERQCKSLFDDKLLGSTSICVQYDKESHGFDLIEVSTKLGEMRNGYD